MIFLYLNMVWLALCIYFIQECEKIRYIIVTRSNVNPIALFFLFKIFSFLKNCYYISQQDELLAVSEKLILKLEDLVTLIKNDVIWTAGRSALCDNDIHCDNSVARPASSSNRTNPKKDLPDVEKERAGDGRWNKFYFMVQIWTKSIFLQYGWIV